jgi:hypothetical protein
MAFWITSRMKAKREQAYGDLLIIKLFASNYARDLKKIRPSIQYSSNLKIPLLKNKTNNTQDNKDHGDF